MSTPKDGTVLNGAFWVNEDSWLILDYTKPLGTTLAESLADQRQYIERLTKRADALQKWLDEHGTEKWLEKKPKP